MGAIAGGSGFRATGSRRGNSMKAISRTIGWMIFLYFLFVYPHGCGIKMDSPIHIVRWMVTLYFLFLFIMWSKREKL
jgi:hypothetical protein